MSRRINVALLILVFVLGSQNYIFAADVEKPPLSASGIIQKTNEVRVEDGLSPLRENFILNEVAKARLDDMFELQYYEHVSPCGIRAKDFAERKGYTYKFLGENLNLVQGYEPTDEIMVKTWLKSPSHRSNMLDGQYQEIGVAVGRGLYRGKETWIAVQVFAAPAKACISPNARVFNKINDYDEVIGEQKKLLREKETELMNIDLGQLAVGELPHRNELMQQYSGMLEMFNQLIQKRNALIDTYRKEAEEYNNCIAE